MTEPTPYVDELARRLREDAVEVAGRRREAPDDVAVLSGRGDAWCLTWRDAEAGHPVTVVTRESELRRAVHALGRGARADLWPGSSVEDAGFNLLLVHLDEVVATRDTTRPLRITDLGVEWPDLPD